MNLRAMLAGGGLPRRFVILFHPRSGSSWLRSMLAENDHIRMGYELLSQHGPPERQIEAIDDFFRAAPPGVEAAGFKVAPYQITDKRAFVQAMRRHRARIVEVTRGDPLKTAISQIRRRELAKAARKAGGKPVQNRTEEMEVPPPSTISGQELVKQVRRDEMEKLDVKFLARACGRPRLAVRYEELLEDREGVARRLAGFLKTAPISVDRFATRKNTPDALREAVANFDEVIEALEGSEYAHLARQHA